MNNRKNKRNSHIIWHNIWNTKQGKFLIIGGFILIYLCACAIGGSLFWHHQSQKMQAQNSSLQAKITNIEDENKQQVSNLKDTASIRSFESAKQTTDDALNGLLGAMYNWDGSNFADRYNKALKYMDKDVLIKAFTSNAQIPSKKDMEQTAKAYAQNNAMDKLTALQNGIQNINGNNVTGFVWCTSQFQQFGKNTTITMQAQYSFNLKTKKFTNFALEPFSGNTID